MPRSQSRSGSRPPKRSKIENDIPCPDIPGGLTGDDDSSDQLDCTICLQPITNRTVLPTCSHEFCFECILIWTDQSRRCPLCSQNIGEYLIHSIRSRYDYRKRYLIPLRTSPLPPPSRDGALMPNMPRRRRNRQERVWGTRDSGTSDELDRLELSIIKRRWVYEHDLYAKHVASNGYTKYRPYPTPAQFAASQDMISRTTMFLRRELQVWHGLDVEFLTALIISLMKSIDVRSESAVRLISEFLDIDESNGSRRNAEHFSHEVYSYVRSPFRDLFVYDTVVQYDLPPDASTSLDLQRNPRWATSSRVGNDRPRTTRRRGHSSSSTRSSSREYYRDLDGSEISIRSNEELESSLGQVASNRSGDRKQIEDHSNIPETEDIAASSSESRRITPQVKIKGKGKEVAEVSFETMVNDGISNEEENEKTAESLASASRIRPPRTRSLLETVKSHLAANSEKSRGDKPGPTGSRHTRVVGSSDPHKPSILARLSDPQTIVPPAAGGDTRKLLTGNSNEALDSMEARARLLARLIREKKLYSPQSKQANTTSIDLEAVETNLKTRTRLHSRLAAERRAAQVSKQS